MANRTELKAIFHNGAKPDADDFASLFDSYINMEEDEVAIDGNDNLTLPGGLSLSNTTNGQEGTLRYSGSQVEVFSGGSWNPIGGGGAFTPVSPGSDVAFAGGNVGIGSFATPPAHKLDIPLGANSGPAERVRLGNVIAHNGAGNDAAYLGHRSVTSNLGFALRQDSQSNTTLNAGPNAGGSGNAMLILSQQGVPRIQMMPDGDINISPTTEAICQGNLEVGAQFDPKNLTVWGAASKPGGGTFSPTSSDKRVKKNIQSLEWGLKEICDLNPVTYKFNGKAGTPVDGKEYVGLVAQDVSKVVPGLVFRSQQKDKDPELNDLLTYDPSPLTYMLIKAVQELTKRIEKLESKKQVKEKNEN